MGEAARILDSIQEGSSKLPRLHLVELHPTINGSVVTDESHQESLRAVIAIHGAED